MGYLKGFTVTFKTLFDKRLTTEYPHGEDPQARAPPRPSRAQPVRGRHGEVHRVRAVRGRVPGALHLRPRRRQPARRPRVARGSATATSTRSTTCAASTATCASKRARPRRSPRRRCSSSASRTAADAIYTKDELLVGDDGKPKQLPWEDWREGEDEHTSAWMRATSPSGDADFEGNVAWAGELGYGVRAPEPAQPVVDEAGRGGGGRRRGARLMDAAVFIVAATIVLVGAIGVVVRSQPRALARSASS